jgi:hypothetical protein
MNMKKLLAALTLTLLTAASASVQAAGVPGKVSDLAWMTGNWAGMLGPNQLEENWILGEGGSIAAMVRMSGDGATSMFEMITIEEVEGSLVLHIQQWDPGFQPRTPEPQKMELVEVTANSVQFKAVSEGGMATLGYSHPDAESFIIHVGQPNGNVLDLPLQKRSVWK